MLFLYAETRVQLIEGRLPLEDRRRGPRHRHAGDREEPAAVVDLEVALPPTLPGQLPARDRVHARATRRDLRVAGELIEARAHLGVEHLGLGVAAVIEVHADVAAVGKDEAEAGEAVTLHARERPLERTPGRRRLGHRGPAP